MKKIILIAAISLILTGCETANEPNPLPEKDYMPLAAGNYWIYKTYEINSDFFPVSGTENTDSIVVEKSYRLMGLKAYETVVYRNNSPIDTIWFGKWEEEIHQLFTKKMTNIPFMPDTWFRIADFNSDEWHVYDTKRINIALPFEGGTVTDNEARYTYNSEYIAEEMINIDTARVLAHKFTLKPDRIYTFDSLFVDTVNNEKVLSTITITKKQYIHRWFSNKIGMVRYQKDPYAVIYKSKPRVWSFPGKTEHYHGFVMELKHFGLKQ